MAMTWRVRMETQRTRCSCVYTRWEAWVIQDQWKNGPSELRRRMTRQIPMSRMSRGRSMWGTCIRACVGAGKEGEGKIGTVETDFACGELRAGAY